jgi:hypothetical protein
MTTAPVGPAGAAAVLAAIDAAAVRALALIDAGQITPASAAAPSVEPQPPEVQPHSVVAAAAQAAATEQTGLAPLFADLSAALQTPGLPPAVAAAAARLQSFITPTDPPPTGEGLKAAASQSGLLLEATIAATGAPPPDDMKAALLTLRQALASAAEPSPAPTGASAAIATAPGQPFAASALGAKVAVAPPHAEPPPAPPYRDAALRAQSPAPARLPPDAPPATVVRTLLQDVNGALARQVLYQLASLPDAPGPAVAHGDPAQPRWMFELPLATAQGATPTPFEISRDGGRSAAGDDAGPTWRARFSLDLGAAGAVHARVALVGGRVRVGLWAEQPETAGALDAQRGVLTADLVGQQFDAAVTVLAGQPASAAADPGRFVDQAL